MVLVLLTALFPASAFGQSDQFTPFVNKQVWVETSNGGTFRGELLEAGDDRVQVVNADGIILQIPRDRIRSIHEIQQSANGSPALEDAASDRLITVPTAFPMEQGRLQMSNIEIVGVTASYGLTRNFSLWGGATFTGTALNARFAFDLAHGSAGISVGSFVGVNWFGSLTDLIIPYSSFSIGSASRNVTVGVGGIFALSTDLPMYLDFTSFVFVLGGKLPLSSGLALVTENWLLLPYDTFLNAFDEDPTLLPALVLRFTGSRLSWDIGLAVPFTVDPSGFLGAFGLFNAVYPIPLASITYRIQ